MDYLIPLAKSRQELIQHSQESLLRAGFTNLSPGGAIYTLLVSVDEKLADYYQGLDEALKNGFRTSATGIYLDLVGQEMGLPRLGVGSVKIRDNQKFYVPRGVLGDYTGGKDIVISRGAQVTAAEGKPPVYNVIPWRDSTRDWPVWKASQKEIFVRLESVTQGAGANVGPGSLTRHNLPYDFILTTNTQAITTNRAPEDDDSYRFRLSEAMLALQGSNRSALERQLLALPGVDSVILDAYTQGPGSLTVTIVPARGRGDENLLDMARLVMMNALAAGESSTVRLAASRELRLTLRVRGVGDPGALASKARDRLVDYLGLLGAGDPFIVSAAVAHVHQLAELSEVQILVVSLDGQAMPAQNIALASDEIFIVPLPLEQSILVDVVQ